MKTDVKSYRLSKEVADHIASHSPNTAAYISRLVLADVAAQESSKVCSGCNQSLHTAAFSDHRSRADGLSNLCKSCVAVKNYQYRESIANK